MSAASPEISVVVPSHGRLLRLRWLLNALEEQTLERRRFEVIVVHDYPEHAAMAMLRNHPLAVAGVVRDIGIDPGRASAARQRNIGWRAARARVVAFTDDDCRPEPEWLRALVAAAAQNPGAIVQGATRPDPLEHENFVGPITRSLLIEPPDPRAQTANILYPCEVLERVGGFEEALRVGEDMDLCLRARRSGARYVGADDAIVNHAVEAFTLASWYRVSSKWRHLPLMLKLQPSLRRYNTLGVFWDGRHARTLLAVLGLAAGVLRPRAAVLAAPYLLFDGVNRRGPGLRPRLGATAELPSRFAADVIEQAIFAAGSVHYRSLFL